MSTSPYLLPDGNVQIAFSGGRSSAYMLYHILETNGGLPDRVVVTFQNTGREHEATLDFVAEVSRRWGVSTIWLEYMPEAPFFNVIGHNSASRNGEPFEALIKKRKYLPNQQSRFCTIELKVRTAKRYLVSLGWEHWTNCVGFRADESHRLNKPKPKDRWTVWHPMADAGVSKHDVAKFWERQPFDLRLPNVNGKTPGDDWSERMEKWMSDYWYQISEYGRLRRIVAAEPELIKAMREAYGRPIPSGVIKSMVSKPRSAAQFSKRYSHREIRKMVEKQGDWIFNDEAYLCQKDEGECVA